MYWVKKKDLFGCFRIEEIRDKDNETGLNEEGGYRNVNLQCSIRDARSFALKYLPWLRRSYLVLYLERQI